MFFFLKPTVLLLPMVRDENIGSWKSVVFGLEACSNCIEDPLQFLYKLLEIPGFKQQTGMSWEEHY